MKFALLLIFSVPLLCAAQFNVDILKEHNVFTKGEFSFLVIIDQTDAATRINEYLQISELGMILGREDSSIFENIWSAEESPWRGTVAYETSVILNTENLFVIKVRAEGCGAYCESYDRYLTFDAKVGNSIAFEDLFTEIGIQVLKEKINYQRKQSLTDGIIGTYQREIQIKRKLAEADQPRRKEELKEYLEIIGGERLLYSQCLPKIDDFDFIKDFYVDSTKLFVTRDRCSNHGERGIDEVGEFRNSVDLLQVAGLMSEYGMKVLLGESNNASFSTNTGVVFDGLIDNEYPIKLVITSNDGDHVYGKYLYEKVGKALDLRGTRERGFYELEEFSKPGGVVTGKLRFSFPDSNGISKGKWFSTTKELDLKLYHSYENEADEPSINMLTLEEFGKISINGKELDQIWATTGDSEGIQQLFGTPQETIVVDDLPGAYTVRYEYNRLSISFSEMIASIGNLTAFNIGSPNTLTIKGTSIRVGDNISKLGLVKVSNDTDGGKSVLFVPGSDETTYLYIDFDPKTNLITKIGYFVLT